VSIPVYSGHFREAQAERLLWRAGFGPKPGGAKALAKHGVRKAVLSLTRPTSAEKLIGPEPTDDKKRPLAPYDAKGHDHLWWLDRMVRTNHPLVERMTLIWHDWFATSVVGVKSQKLMLDQNALFRKEGLGSFATLLLDVTRDPAMLLWLSGNKNTKQSPNENYARELMELFTLGAYRGYGESDVREQARALTGWRNKRSKQLGDYDFRYDPTLHDDGVKTIFGKIGTFDWQDSCRLCLQNPLHSSFFVRKLWSYFMPSVPTSATQEALEQLYRKSYSIRPVVEAILMHPDLYKGPRMIKPPVVYTAGLLRAMGRGVDSAKWPNLGVEAGQRLFYPPNVAGWDDERWLDTATVRGRWDTVAFALRPAAVDDTASASLPETAGGLVQSAFAYWHVGSPLPATRKVLLDFASKALAAHGSRAMILNALRQLVAVSPDLQTA
jgi:uncharacterized protein (DUF1800 family)